MHKENILYIFGKNMDSECCSLTGFNNYLAPCSNVGMSKEFKKKVRNEGFKEEKK